MPTLAVAAMVALLLASLQASAAPRDLSTELKRADKALTAQEFALAYKEYARVAARNPLAQFNLGLIEREGWGRARNPAAACAWFGKAAQGNIPAAQQFFGDCLAEGIGQAADGKAAEAWYRKAAQAGIVYALCSAGQLYIRGQVVGKDVEHGLGLCAQAAQAGSAPAMLRIADYYKDGTEVPQNLAAARSWYQQAAENRDHLAQYRLGVMLGQGEGGDVNPALALSWLEHAASEGYAPAYLPVAILYANSAPDPATGALTPANLAKIYMWNSAAKATTNNAATLAEIERIAQLVNQVMPAEWRPTLDRRVAEHLSRFSAN
ncbi:tetratricopeptide repeat protein [Janthinobacterium sp. SUN073]|uniref:tetratricopeptide repeat protein n=1 Tax=Janthinobacterium sp. SUN073 TaxID=3004102 RepID=UPI0025B06F28|nr:tetratricopeptide repeat protein [Janthinobacterium sp. SUN073]MDN2696388.1 tetratricopeptide repeat protein [Janthinobacterium sp. SUN073]